MIRHYHNTTGELFPELGEYELAAESQDEMVLRFFYARPGLQFSSDEIHQRLLPDCPRTSAVRALSNLKKRGLLIVVDRTIGKYNRPTYVWKLKIGK